MKAFFKSMAIIVGLLLVLTIIAAALPSVGIWPSALLLGASLIAIVKPIPRMGLGHRGFSLALALLVGLPATMIALGAKTPPGEKQMASSEGSDPPAASTELPAVADAAKQAAKAEKLAEARAREDALAQEEKRARIAEYLEELDREMGELRKVDASQFAQSVDTIRIGILMLERWSGIYGKATAFQLDADGQQKRRQYRRLLAEKQAEMLPALRDAYGPAMRQKLWEFDASARTIGPGYRTVEFVSAEFVRNANIKKFHLDMLNELMKMRFTRAQYKWFKDASEYSFFKLEPPKDSELVKWYSNGTYRALD